MNNQEALNKMEQATSLMCEVLGKLKGHHFTNLDTVIKTCYGIEDYFEQEIIRESKALTYRNNWESDEYYLGDKKLEIINIVEIDGKIYDVVARNVSKSYSDHGHTYTATSRHYFIQERVFGTVMEVDLNTICNKTKVWFVE